MSDANSLFSSLIKSGIISSVTTTAGSVSLLLDPDDESIKVTWGDRSMIFDSDGFLDLVQAVEGLGRLMDE